VCSPLQTGQHGHLYVRTVAITRARLARITDDSHDVCRFSVEEPVERSVLVALQLSQFYAISPQT